MIWTLTVGLIKPIGDLLTAKRASLTRVRMAPTTGDDAEVPYTKRNFPLTCKEEKTRKN